MKACVDALYHIQDIDGMSWFMWIMYCMQEASSIVTCLGELCKSGTKFQLSVLRGGEKLASGNAFLLWRFNVLLYQ